MKADAQDPVEKEFRGAREDEIKDILDRGKVVVFTNRFTDEVKYVYKWEVDGDNELVAALSNGELAYVYWPSHRYDVSEMTKEEVPTA